MDAAAPSAADLKRTSLKKVTTKETDMNQFSEEDKKPFKDVWAKCGSLDKVKKEAQYSKMKWRSGFNPQSADEFAAGILSGLAFDD